MLKKALLLGSALGFATILSMGVTNAQDQPTQSQQKIERGGDNDCGNNEDCTQGSKNRVERKRQGGEQDQIGDNDQDQGANRKKKRLRAESDDMDMQGDGNRSENRREARRDWSYDSQRHKRSRNKDATFRFYFGGYYYPERYWDEPVIVLSTRGRVSCREGRRIVDNSGFNRVRTVECDGRNYTYMGRRHGDDFRVVLNSRNGRIVSVREL
jgi:hypothetical protein